MKKITLSLLVSLALSASAFAEDTSDKTFDGDFYVGIGYGYTDNSNKIGNVDTDASTNNVLIQAGYDFNKYIGIEARLWEGVGGTDATQTGGLFPGTYDVSDSYAWGAYVKPQFPILDSLNVYGMLGYAVTSLKYNGTDTSTDGFSWGLGAEYYILDNSSLFVDYVNLGSQDSATFVYVPSGATQDTSASIDVYSVNVGIKYKF